MEEDFTYASLQDWDRFEAREIGARNPDRAYIATGNDVWHVNPFWGKYDKWGNPLRKEAPYSRIRHPEDVDSDDFDEELIEQLKRDEEIGG
tara:strand:+ start:140 stop:412 length:273 start_codon:yes stop_codon:yes gene_type:complete